MPLKQHAARAGATSVHEILGAWAFAWHAYWSRIPLLCGPHRLMVDARMNTTAGGVPVYRSPVAVGGSTSPSPSPSPVWQQAPVSTSSRSPPYSASSTNSNSPSFSSPSLRGVPALSGSSPAVLRSAADDLGTLLPELLPGLASTGGSTCSYERQEVLHLFT